MSKKMVRKKLSYCMLNIILRTFPIIIFFIIIMFNTSCSISEDILGEINLDVDFTGEVKIIDSNRLIQSDNIGIRAEILETGDYTHTDSNGYWSIEDLNIDSSYTIEFSHEGVCTRRLFNQVGKKYPDNNYFVETYMVEIPTFNIVNDSLYVTSHKINYSCEFSNGVQGNVLVCFDTILKVTDDLDEYLLSLWQSSDLGESYNIGIPKVYLNHLSISEIQKFYFIAFPLITSPLVPLYDQNPISGEKHYNGVSFGAASIDSMIIEF